jgi:hypothetical protein
MEALATQVQTLERPALDVLDMPTSVDHMMARLDKLGFKTALKKLDGAQKLAIAYAKYGFVSQEKVSKFNEKLRVETITQDKMARSYKQLLFTPIENYAKVPPHDALYRLEAAMADAVFDGFEVATIQWVKEVVDPIIFGRVDGCTDRFFIAQWDDDVKIEDIVGA